MTDVNLTIDHGNTRTKLAMWAAGDSRSASTADTSADRQPLAAAAMKSLDARALDKFLDGHTVAACCLCSVAGGDDDGRLRRLLEKRCRRLLVLDPATTRTPLRVGYATPQTLGADRLAAAVGAWQIVAGGKVLVVDVGTAVTYDLVDNGVFVGGNIAPGINMRLRALNRYTDRLPLVDSTGPVEDWGRDTAMALRAGAVDGVVAEIEYYRRRLGPGAGVILTGGAAQLVSARLSFDARTVPDLVCLGLRHILRSWLDADTVNENQSSPRLSGAKVTINET